MGKDLCYYIELYFDDVVRTRDNVFVRDDSVLR